MAVRHMPQPQAGPTPERFFQAINAYQITAALRTAIELELFTAIQEGASTPAELAARVHADARRIRMLCDFLTVEGHLTKHDGRYGLPEDTATFLVKTSPAYLGGTIQFLLCQDHMRAFENLTTIVKHGVPAEGMHNTVAPENPMWVDFARSMSPMMRMPAEGIAQYLVAGKAQPWKVLDIAAGHGLFGIAMARHNPQAKIVAVDWGGVLKVAQENAAHAGVAERYSTLPGSAFEVDFGSGYDVALVTNFLHHFDHKTVVGLLRKIHTSLKPGGRVAVLEFVPEEDRISPPLPAKFAIIMLAGTPGGDAYPYSQYQKMFQEAGFASSELVRLPGPESLVVAHK